MADKLSINEGKGHVCGVYPSPNGDMSQYVKLNVGGHLFYTTLDTLTKEPDTMFSSMFSGRLPVATDAEGWVLIDRSGTHFATILNYLRDRTVALPDNKKEVLEILAEAQYYCISGLINQCSSVESRAPCSVPLITTDAEKSLLVRNTTKPVVVFVAHHGERNNYGENFMNLRRNEQLFEQLKLRFNGRIVFIKDIRSGSKLLWEFYSRGICTAEVNCISATGTIVLPEITISRELLNICEYSVVPLTLAERFANSLCSNKKWILGSILFGYILYRYKSW